MKKEIKFSEDIRNAIRLVAPGTPLHKGIEFIIKGRLGALITITTDKNIDDLMSGGFKINTKFKPEYLWELAKMDGAIILSGDAEKILRVNVQLIPNYKIKTDETGMRHRTAERVAKQSGNLVIAISSRRNTISLYKNDTKYIFKEIPIILSNATQMLLTIEKYKIAFEKFLNNLNRLEFRDNTMLYDVCLALQKYFMILKLKNELDINILELGEYGEYILLQLNEMMTTIADGRLIIKDYMNPKTKKRKIDINSRIEKMLSKQFFSNKDIAKLIEYNNVKDDFEIPVSPRGYRLLSKIQRLDSEEIEKIITKFKTLSSFLKAEKDELNKLNIPNSKVNLTIEKLKQLSKQYSLI